MSNEVESHPDNMPDNNDEAAMPNPPNSELSDADLSNVAGGTSSTTGQPVDPQITVRKAGGNQETY